MRRDLDPIKIIQILPFSNRSDKPPQGPNPLLELLKKAFRDARESVARVRESLQGRLARAQVALASLYSMLATRMRPQKRAELPPNKPACQAEREQGNALPTHAAEPSPNLQHHTLIAVSAWIGSIQGVIRTACRAAWPARRLRLSTMKNKLAGRVLECREKIRRTRWAQESWRAKTDQIVRPLTSAVRSLRLRHQRLLDRLNSTHSIVQSQQQEITELTLQLASMKTEIATQKKSIEELAHQVKSLQIQVAQTLPITHGTTGQSGPPAHGRRGPATTKRNGPSETGPQSKAEH